MQPDDVRIHDTREWIARSREDLDMAAFALTPNPPFLRDCLFHSQQAVEKACKAFLTFHDESFTKTHNLIDLGLQCARADGRLRELASEAAPMNVYAVQFRYPGEPYHPEVEEARSALASARKLVAEVLACLPSEVQSSRPGTVRGDEPTTT